MYAADAAKRGISAPTALPLLHAYLNELSMSQMDAKELSAFLTPQKMTARETLLCLTGGAIALLLVAAGTSFYKRDYRDGILCFLVATLLGFVFFRKRKFALVVSGFKHVHTVFEGEEAMAAENARIEPEARELMKKRPYGPWLFR
jgi:hypothetical protein